MKLAKILPNGILDMRICDPKIGSRVTELRNAGFLDYIPSEQPKCDAGYIAKDSYKIIDGKVVQSWEIKTESETIL